MRMPAAESPATPAMNDRERLIRGLVGDLVAVPDGLCGWALLGCIRGKPQNSAPTVAVSPILGADFAKVGVSSMRSCHFEMTMKIGTET